MANTPFLDLVKPAGTDRALVSVINSNSDKIDGGVSTLSEQISTTDIGSTFSTLASLESAFDTFASNMPNNSRRNIAFRCTATCGMFTSTFYIADITKIATNRYHIEARRTNSPDIVYCWRTDSGWNYNRYYPTSGTITPIENVTINRYSLYKFANVVELNAVFTVAAEIANGGTVFSVESGYAPTHNIDMIIVADGTSDIKYMRNTGIVDFKSTGGKIPVGTYRISCVYII